MVHGYSWDGIPLATLLKDADPDPHATHVAFESIVRPAEMPGQTEALSGIQWPYVEGLRLDEAMNPLTLLALGIYGETLPNQNGAPCGWSYPGNMGSKGSSRSSASACWTTSPDNVEQARS